jgi:hypothetical protein
VAKINLDKFGVDELALWKRAGTEAAAEAAVAIHGPLASLAAAWCAFIARYDGRNDDYRFWFAVFLRLRRSQMPETEAGRHDPG